MTGFKFPPPPPPPPKAAANDFQDTYSSQRGGYNNGRGSGRGRGWSNRGGGHNTRGGGRRGTSSGPSQSRGDRHDHGNCRGNQQRGGHDGLQHQNATTPHNDETSQHGSINTSWGSVQQPANPAVLAHALSFMTTPSGMQTMAAFASHMANGSQNATTYQTQQAQPMVSPSSPPGNKKRKRPESIPRPAASSTSQSPAQKSKPPRAHAATAPAIPSFGFALPTVRPTAGPHTARVTATQKSGHANSKHKTNLGLTQRQDMASDSDSDAGVDEEADFAQSGQFQAMAFEYDGQSMSLQSPADIAEWIRERRKQFPTQKRVAQKAQEATERREAELNFLARVKGTTRRADAKTTDKGDASDSRKHKPHASSSRSNTATSPISKRQQPRAVPKTSARPAIESKTAAANVPRQALDLGLGYGSDSDAISNASSLLEESSVVSSSSSDDSDAESDSDASNSEPEQQPSKVAPATIVAPPPQPVPPKQKDGPRICAQWQKYGRCKMREGRRCRFAHPADEKKEVKRVGLFERLVEQEMTKSDQLALDAIKFLGRNGFLG